MLANAFAPHDGILRVHLIAHGADPAKSDAFLLEYNGTYLMIDGGSPATDAALQYLLGVRRTLLAEHPELIEDESCRLHLDLIATHCHVDHVGAWHAHILCSPYLEIGTVRMPPDSAIAPHHVGGGVDGDARYRPKIARALKNFQPQANVLTHEFGAAHLHTFRMISDDPTSPTVTVCPAVCDWGIGDKVEYIIKHYHPTGESLQGVPVQVVNNCSDWFHIRHGSRTFLFTGDNVKKFADYDDESADLMTNAYLPILGSVDVVKYIHHGYKRDAGAADMMAFEPSYVIIGAEQSTGGEAIRAKFPHSPVKIVNFALQTYVFTTDGETLTVSPEV